MRLDQRKNVDDIAIERRINGDTKITLNVDERDIAVELLDRRGLTDTEISGLVGIAVKTVQTIRLRFVAA